MSPPAMVQRSIRSDGSWGPCGTTVERIRHLIDDAGSQVELVAADDDKVRRDT